MWFYNNTKYTLLKFERDKDKLARTMKIKIIYQFEVSYSESTSYKFKSVLKEAVDIYQS